jgi:hypothetical protein
MQSSEARQLGRSQRVQQFGIAQPEVFPAGSHAATVLADHKAAATEAEQQAARQVAAMLEYQENTEQKNVAIKSLILLMRLINRTARSINKQFPGIADQFRMPTVYSDQEILNRARAFITAATPIAVEFTKRGLPESFPEDLQAAIDAVEAAEARQSKALANQVTATAALGLALKQEQEVMIELNIIVRNYFRNDPGTLAAWASASHVERAPKRKKKATPPPPPPTP